MAEVKTKATTLSPAAFIKRVDGEERRKDCQELVALMQETTGQPPTMWGPAIVGFDRYRYKYASGREGEMCLTGFSPRKADLVLYVSMGIDDKRLLTRLGKHKTGKGCLHIKKLADVDRQVLRTVVERAVAGMRRRYPESGS